MGVGPLFYLLLGVLVWFRASGFRVLGFGLLGLEALGFQGGFHLLRALGPFTSWDSEFFLYHVSEERLLLLRRAFRLRVQSMIFKALFHVRLQ